MFLARFEPVCEATIYMAKTNRDTIYNQIIKDLQEASTLLYAPGTKYTNTVKMISKDAARGLLARICLSAAGYSQRPCGHGCCDQNNCIGKPSQGTLYHCPRCLPRNYCRRTLQT